MSTRSRASKRQTTLGFNPLGSESPAAELLPESIRKRAATVTYSGSPAATKRRRLDSEQDEKDDIAPGSQTLENTPRRLRSTHSSSKRKRQGKIDFSFHHTSERPTQSSSSPGKASTPKRSKRRAKSGLFGGTRNISIVDVSSTSSKSTDSSDVEEDELPIPASNRKTRSQPGNIDSDSEGPISNIRTPRTVGRVTRGSTQRARAKRVTIISDEEAESDESDIAADGPANKFSIQDLGEPETSGDEVTVSSPTVKSRRVPRKSQAAKDTFINDDSEESDDTPRRRVSRVRLKTPESITGSAEDDHEEAPPTVSKREREDLKEDLDFLQSSPPTSVRKSQSTKQSARQMALELLKRRRAGDRSDPVGENENSSQGSEENGAASPDAVDEEVNEDISEDEEDEPPTASYRDMFRAGEEDEDFIVDDPEGDETVVLANMQVPLHLTAHGRMKPRELFKYVVEWMIQKKINPTFQMDDEIYRLAFLKLDDEVQGLSSSKFESSVWRKDFRFALRARPRLIAVNLSAGDRIVLGMPGCDACGRQSHPATFQVSFEGKPYQKETLENVSDDDDSDIEGPDDLDYDAQGHQIAKEGKSWNLGIHCKNNAEIAHTLHHWRYHLYEWIVDYLIAEDHLSKDKLFERESWSRKKKRKYANNIVDAMAADGEIDSLYKDFKNNLEAARNAKPYAHKKK